MTVSIEQQTLPALTPAVATSSLVEGHSIDFVPLAERYGTPRRLFTVWFSANMTVLGIALGTLAVTSGLSLGWAILAFVLGNGIGTVFMAAHSAQGPQLGIPQMIQSRAQFGVLGAGLPLLAVIVTYLLYCAANGVLIQGVITSLVPIGSSGALLVLPVLTVLIAFVGYELIHRLGAVMTAVSTITFAVAAYLLITKTTGAEVAAPAVAPVAALGFSGSVFILTVTQAAAWSLGYGPYVADYSRYLPPDVPPSHTFWYSGLGCFLSSTLIMALGAYFVTLDAGFAQDPGGALARLFGPWQGVVYVIILVGVVQGNVMNLYSAYMSTVTVFSGIRGMRRVSRGTKLFVMLALMAIATVIAMIAQQNFNAYFSDALSIMLYMLVPWSAINLADYYLVRKGRYNIADMFRVEGEYGAYRWQTIAVYLLGVLVQIPFMSLTFYRSPIAALVGADLGWLPALVIPAVLYVLVERRVVNAARPV